MPDLPPRRPLVIAAALFVVAALAFALRDNLTSNELDTLLTARRFVDPDYLPGDWFLGLAQGPRRPFQFVLWPLLRVASLPVASVLGRLLGYAGLSLALGKLASRLGIGPALAVVLGGLYVAFGQSVAGGEWLFGTIESKVAAYALVLFALDAWLDARVLKAAILLGLATTLHVLVGAQATLALGLCALLDWPGPPGYRARAQALVVWTLAAAPGLVILADAAGSKVQADPPVSWIYVVFRTPHHSDPTTWHLSWRAWAAILVLGPALVLVPRWRPGQPDLRRLARFASAALVPFALGLLAALLPGGHKFLQLLPFRVGGALAPLLGLLLLGAWLAAVLPPLLAKWLPGLLATAVLVLAGLDARAELQTWRDFPRGGRPSLARTEGLDLANAATWIRDHSPRTAVVLAAPTHESVGYLADRAVVVTYKQTPPGHAEVVAWFHRIVAFAGGIVPPERGHALLPALDLRFEQLPPPTYAKLAHDYGGDVLLVRRRDLTLPVLYRNAGWTVYSLRGPPGP
jgi:hypothetical protein